MPTKTTKKRAAHTRANAWSRIGPHQLLLPAVFIPHHRAIGHAVSRARSEQCKK